MAILSIQHAKCIKVITEIPVSSYTFTRLSIGVLYSPMNISELDLTGTNVKMSKNNELIGVRDSLMRLT